jgi:xanthine dehydrogenase accessory factor
MENLDRHVLETALDWHDSGYRVVMGTVVRTWGSAPRPVGSLLAVRDDGQVVGSVSGGCIEDDLVHQLRTGAMTVDVPKLVAYGTSADEARRFGLPCGGTMQILLEPISQQGAQRELAAMLAANKVVTRVLDVESGAATLQDGERNGVLSFTGRCLRTTHGPGYRLLIIGGGQVAQYLADIAVTLNFAVTVCEPRDGYRHGWRGFGSVVWSTDMPDDLVLSMLPDACTAVVALTHDPKLDDLALMEALKLEAFYVGAIGSKANHDKRLRRLAEFGVTASQAARLRGPIGLAIGAMTPSEIAVAIAAELVAVKRQACFPIQAASVYVRHRASNSQACATSV